MLFTVKGKGNTWRVSSSNILEKHLAYAFLETLSSMRVFSYTSSKNYNIEPIHVCDTWEFWIAMFVVSSVLIVLFFFLPSCCTLRVMPPYGQDETMDINERVFV